MCAQETPISIQFEGKELAFWTYSQLNQLSSTALKQRAMNVRDAVGEDRLSRMPRDKENCIAWIINAQIRALSSTSGEVLTPLQFGLPKDLADQNEKNSYEDLAPPAQPSTTEPSDYDSQRAIYHAARIKNRNGSNIFGQN